MKRCPECNRTYSDETFSFCLADGALLSAPYDPDATLISNSFDLETTLVSSQDVKPYSVASTIIDDPVVAININQQYTYVKNSVDLYNCTRGLWRVNRMRANKARYAFAVYKGVIKEVYEINQWLSASKETIQYWKEKLKSQGKESELKYDGRYEFTGKLAPDDIREKYINKKMPLLHSQNPIRYINC